MTKIDTPKEKARQQCAICHKPLKREGAFTAWIFSEQHCNCTKKLDNDAVLTSRPDGMGSLKPGTVLNNQFVILGLLATGGMSEVYKAEYKRIGDIVAIKMLRPEIARDPQAVLRFRREALALQKIKSRHVVTIYAMKTAEDGREYHVLELIKGRTLGDILKKHGALSQTRVSSIFSQLCDALAAAHSCDIVHRDLKPDNIIVIDEGAGKELVKILDFGIARMTILNDSYQLTTYGDVFGSPAYMSPEQTLGHTTDARSDQYSLACVTFQLLTNTLPFSSKNPVQNMLDRSSLKAPKLREVSQKTFPDNIERTLAKMLSTEPKHRFHSITQAKDAFLGTTDTKKEHSILISLAIVCLISLWGIVETWSILTSSYKKEQQILEIIRKITIMQSRGLTPSHAEPQDSDEAP